MRYITFALAKGRLAKKAMALLEEIGITCEEMKDEKTRKLIFVNEELKLKFFLSKASDVPTYVEYGAADIGVVGKDTILEEGRNLYEVLDLKFGACKMCVCGPKEAKKYLNSNEIIRVASKYPHIAKEYFNNQKLQTVEIVKLNGSVELAPIVGLSEVIVDIVETGATLRENGLEVYELLDDNGNFMGYYEPYSETNPEPVKTARYTANINWEIPAGKYSYGENQYTLSSGSKIQVSISQSQTGTSYLTFQNRTSNSSLRFTNTKVTNGWKGTVVLGNISSAVYSFGIENASSVTITYTGSYSL